MQQVYTDQQKVLTISRICISHIDKLKGHNATWPIYLQFCQNASWTDHVRTNSGASYMMYMDEVKKLHKIYFSTLFYNIPF